MPAKKAKFSIKLAGIITGIFAFILGFSGVVAAATSYSGVDISAQVGSVAPHITSISPNSVTAGTSAFVMDIYGTNFEAAAVARYDGGGRVTTFINAGHIQANITAGDVAAAATHQITVWNPGTATLSNQVAFNVTTPSGGGGGGAGDVQPPVISNVQAINITQTTARIIWDTNENATSLVNYGLTNAYGDSVSNGSLVMSHGLDLSGLTPNTTYHFKVTSADQYGNIATSADYTFTTLPVAALIISNVTSTGITDISSFIIWDTNRPATSKVLYGTTPALGMWNTAGGYVSNHNVWLSSLTPNTLYYYQVTSMDAGGNSATSSIYTFRTLADTTAPTNISLTATPGDTVVQLDWTHPPEPDFAGVRVIRKLGSFPTGPMDGVLVYDGLNITKLDTGLTNGVTYYYAAYAYDIYGNYSSGSLDDATPFGTITVVPTSTPPLPPATTTPPIVTPPIVTPPVVTPPTGTTTTTPPVVTPPTLPALKITVIYYTANGTLMLQPDEEGVYGVLGAASVLAKVPTTSLTTTAKTVTLNVNGQLYTLALSSDGTAYTGTFIAPTSGTFQSTVSAVFQDNRQATTLSNFTVEAAGKVVESTLTGIKPTLPGATVTLEELVDGQWTVWNGAPYGQSNPVQSGPDGSYVYVVPNGTYRVKVEKSEFQNDISDPISIKRNVFGDEVPLIRLPKVVATSTPAVVQVVKNVPDYATFAALNVIKIAKSEPAKEVVTYTVPAVLAVSIINAASAFSLFNLLAYLQFLFTQPLLLFGRTKRKRWGVVYNALTKQPIEFTIVRLINQDTNMVMQTRVTDKNGRYFFQVKKGSYRLEAVKPGFAPSPTQYLADVKQDLDYPDLYHGENVNMQDDGILALNIPLDPLQSSVTPRKITIRKYLKFTQHTLAILGVILAGLAFIIYPTVYVGIVFIAQAIFYLLFRRLSLPAKARNWGRVYDSKTRKPLGKAIVRIFDKKFNKLLETQLTDNGGGFGFFVGRNIYYITVEKAGFGKFTSKDINLSSGKEMVVDMDVALVAAAPKQVTQ